MRGCEHTKMFKECRDRWPEAEPGAYDPRCCRFPKSCSPEPWDETPEELLVDIVAPPTAEEIVRRVRERHRVNTEDEVAQGYHADQSYGYFEQFCVECTSYSNGEYAVKWPCPTYRDTEADL